jgi:hypothetical protein
MTGHLHEDLLQVLDLDVTIFWYLLACGLVFIEYLVH